MHPFSIRKQNKKRSGLHIIWKILIGGSITIALFLGYNEYRFQEDIKTFVSDSPQKITVEISGSISHIAHSLEEKKLIVSADSFVRYIQRENLDTKIQAGKNILSANMTIPEIANTLLTAYSDTTIIRIPEGYTLQEVDTYLSKKDIIPAGSFIDCVKTTCQFPQASFLPKERKNWEGYFFPATYQIDTDLISPEKIAQEMLRGFEINAQKSGAFNHSSRSLQDLVTMASMIEKESSTYTGDESQMIADVLWKRIDEGIPLGVDATIRYALSIKNAPLTRKNLRQNTPFNTRRNKGLPPHAISNFSAHSLFSAAHPKKNNFYYYLHQKGIIHYGKTNAEHEKNKQIYCGGSCE